MIIKILLVMMAFVPGSFSSHAQQFTQKENFEKWLEGEWVPLDIGNCQKNKRILTFHDGYFTISPTVFRYAYSISDAIHQDGYWEMYLSEAMASSDGGQNFSEIGNLDGPDEKIRVRLYVKDNVLVLLPHKAEGRTAGQVITPEAFVKTGSLPHLQYTSSVQSVFIVPDGFTGSAWIAMNQPKGEPFAINNEGLPVIELPASGLLKSQVPIMAEALAKREFAFYFQTDRAGDSQPIPHIHYKCLDLFRSEGFSEEEVLSHGYDMEQVYVMFHRYDTPGREKINELFGERIEGQVMHFRVGKLRDLIAF